MADYVLDASAILAELHQEPGAETVRAARRSACMSAVNYAEVIAKLLDEGVPLVQAETVLARLHCDIIEADKYRSLLVGALHEKTRRKGISLADRYCLQLAKELGLPLLTSDRDLRNLDVGVDVRPIR
jgi:PIN domain nuclease of toxin-antitoxin system